ncbi:ABC transporter permease [Methanolacinia paynteri]|uniref:ABC transporter permease n=1 Tax=Methanolacinia paynteri TaxID=230356 RepID=UPI00064F8731|nr:ABC transporter permease subunit [Methanolacinia paynteri]
MKSVGLFAITEKEFQDHTHSRKFLMFLSIILVVTIIGMASGSVDYNKQIDDYNEQVSVVDENSETDSYWYKPSIMTIFNSVGALLASLGAILGIAMGFDLITKEKESKSLKILLSHPIYRDEVINGKAAGGILALLLALFVTFIIAAGIMLIFGIVPSGEDFIYIAFFGLAAFLMIFSYFAISMFMSTVAEDSGNSLVYTLILFVFLSSLLPVFVWSSTTDLIIGPAPEYPEGYFDIDYGFNGAAVTMTVSDTGEVTKTENAYVKEEDEAWEKYMDEMEEYWGKREMLSGFISLLSPTNNFQDIMNTLTYSSSGFDDLLRSSYSPADKESAGVMDVLGKLLWNFVALIAIPAVFFGAAYVRFMRIDVR